MRAIEDVIEVHPEKCAGCMSCQLICSFTFTQSFNPLEAYILVDVTGRMGEKIKFTDDCTACGICAKYCSYGALEVKGGGEK